MKENKFNIGDSVRIVSNDSAHEFRIGEICKIVGINTCNYDVENDRGGNWYVLAEDMELESEDSEMLVRLRELKATIDNASKQLEEFMKETK